jgi:hypothetical protein
MRPFPSTVAALLLLCGGALGGCAFRLTPPANVNDPVLVYVVDYGRHASLAVPGREGVYIEYDYGDWDWYARDDTGVLEAVRSQLGSRGAALGFRELPKPRDAAHLAAMVGAEQALPIRVERKAAYDLVLRINRRILRGEGPVLTNHGRSFVRDAEGGYGLLHNSNHQVAQWLREMDVKVAGSSVDASFRAPPLPPLPTPQSTPQSTPHPTTR